MSMEAVSRLDPDQIIAILSDGTEAADPAPNRRVKAQKEILDAVRARFGLTVAQLLAQPVAITKRQIIEARPALTGVDDAFLANALREYGR